MAEPDRLKLPAGLTSDRADSLADLVAAITGQSEARGDLPWLAPALIFADPAVQRGLHMPPTDPGEVLLQDYQAIRYSSPFPLDRPLIATVQQDRRKTSADFRFALSGTEGTPCAELDTALRVVSGAEVGKAQPARSRPDAGQGASDVSPMAVSQAQVDRYLALSGDRNPIHFDPAIARAMGLRAAVVPGLLLISLIQPACRRAAPGTCLQELKARFLAPVCVDEAFRVVVQSRGEGAAPGSHRLRAHLLGPGDGAVAIADLSVVATAAR